MEEDEDDFYGGGGGGGAEREEQLDGQAAPQDEMDVLEEGEDDDDSDDDVQFTLERPDGAKTEPPPGSKAAKSQKKETGSKAVKIEADKRSSTPSRREKEDVPRAGSAAPSAAPSAAVKGTLTHNGKEGKDFPETRMSQLDVNQVPTWVNGKPITAVDIDADLAEHSKPWRLPGTDQTDYFNYGFDEYTWTQYSLRQQEMSGTINQLKQNDAQMKAMLGLGGQQQGGGMPPMPPMPPEMMGMDPQVMAQQMGIPVEMVQQFMQSGGMPPGMGGPQGFNQQGGGFGNNDGASPQPQAGQGFQPPQGPGGGQQMSMEGLSAQQMAIFQQEQQQQQQMGGGHRGGRNRRGRW